MTKMAAFFSICIHKLFFIMLKSTLPNTFELMLLISMAIFISFFRMCHRFYFKIVTNYVFVSDTTFYRKEKRCLVLKKGVDFCKSVKNTTKCIVTRPMLPEPTKRLTSHRINVPVPAISTHHSISVHFGGAVSIQNFSFMSFSMMLILNIVIRLFLPM